MRARDICLIAILSATLTAGKMALSFIANVEVVTLLLTVYALTLPRSRVLIATVTFILTDILIWGAHIWVIMYFIHWPALVISVSFLKGKYAPLFAIIIAVLLTGLFGVQTTLLEVLLLTNYRAIGFAKCFLLRYGTGIPYFITHVVSNACILSVLTYPMYRLMRSLYRQFFRVPGKKEVRVGVVSGAGKILSVSEGAKGAGEENTSKPPSLTDAARCDTMITRENSPNESERKGE